MNLDNRTALVSGANRGIGRAIVAALLGTDIAKVYAAARDPASLIDFGDPRVIPLALDITDAAQVRAAAERATDVDLLINNAGVAGFASLLDGEHSLAERDMQTNYFGTLNMVRAFVPVLERQPSAAIVNLVTIAAFANFPFLGGYSASKAALFLLSQGIRIELAPRGIAVHTVNPGPIDTDLAADLAMDKAEVQATAEQILRGLERGDADIFPDPTSQQMFEVWQGDYRALERMVQDMLSAA